MRERIRTPLRLRANNGEERHATWLELFFDVFFVITVSELGHNLSGNVSLGGVIGFVALFVPIWWAWVGETFMTRASTATTSFSAGSRLRSLA